MWSLVYQIPIAFLCGYLLHVGRARMQSVKVYSIEDILCEMMNQAVGVLLVLGSVFALILLFR